MLLRYLCADSQGHAAKCGPDVSLRRPRAGSSRKGIRILAAGHATAWLGVGHSGKSPAWIGPMPKTAEVSTPVVQPIAFDIPGAARFLSATPGAVRGAIYAGKLSYKRVGKRIIIPRSVL